MRDVIHSSVGVSSSVMYMFMQLLASKLKIEIPCKLHNFVVTRSYISPLVFLSSLTTSMMFVVVMFVDIASPRSPCLALPAQIPYHFMEVVNKLILVGVLRSQTRLLVKSGQLKSPNRTW